MSNFHPKYDSGGFCPKATHTARLAWSDCGVNPGDTICDTRGGPWWFVEGERFTLWQEGECQAGSETTLFLRRATKQEAAAFLDGAGLPGDVTLEDLAQIAGREVPEAAPYDVEAMVAERTCEAPGCPSPSTMRDLWGRRWCTKHGYCQCAKCGEMRVRSGRRT